MKNTEIIKKLDYTINYLLVRPDNEPNSEFADRIDDLLDIKEALNIHNVIVPLCECGGNERVALDCISKKCKHPKYYKEYHYCY